MIGIRNRFEEEGGGLRSAVGAGLGIGRVRHDKDAIKSHPQVQFQRIRAFSEGRPDTGSTISLLYHFSRRIKTVQLTHS